MMHRRGAGAAVGGRAVLAAVAAAVGLAWAAPARAQAGEQAIKATVLVAERPALERWVVDPKDKRLADALGMIPARVRELPHDFPEFPAPVASVVNLVLSTIARPASIALTYDSDNPEGTAFGYGLVVSFEMKDQQDGEQLHAQIGGMIAAAGAELPMQPSERWRGMTALETPIGPLSYGPRQAKRGWRYEVIVGHVRDPETGLDSLPKVDAGLTPTVRGRIDFAGLTPVLSMAQAFAPADPGTDFFFEGLQEAGFWGPDALKVNFVAGYTNDEGRVIATFEGARRYADAWHTSVEPLAPADLAAIPADAVWAGLGKADFVWLEELIAHFSEFNDEAREGFARFREQIGVDPKTDVLAALGGTMGFYMSDSTGGGSLASAVVLTTFKDRARFMGAHAKLVAFANQMADQAPQPIGGGHIKVTGWKDGDVELFSLRFPGLPVPLEPTWAATEKWLIIGATPQAAVAAARQATGKGDKGLSNNTAFAAAMPKGIQPISIGFLDTNRMLKSGYPLLSLLGSAIGNGVRSPVAPDRDPGMIVPAFNDLAKGARASVQLEYWRGDDLVQESRGDRSILVNAGAAAGVVMEIAPLIAIPAAAAAANHGEFGMLDEGLLPRTALAAVMNPRVPWVIRQQALVGAGAWIAQDQILEGDR